MRQTVVLLASTGHQVRINTIRFFFDIFELYLDKPTDNTLVVIADLNSGFEIRSPFFPSVFLSSSNCICKA